MMMPMTCPMATSPGQTYAAYRRLTTNTSNSSSPSLLGSHQLGTVQDGSGWHKVHTACKLGSMHAMPPTRSLSSHHELNPPSGKYSPVQPALSCRQERSIYLCM